MTPVPNFITRRTAIRTGGAVITALATGAGAVSTVTAENGPPEMIVDAPPTIAPSGNGQVVMAIYPGGEMSPSDVVNHNELDGFKLGPIESNVEEDGADAVRYRLVNNGVHGEAAGVFFDATTADEWFEPGTATAKLSAIDEDAEVVAWGDDQVNVR